MTDEEKMDALLRQMAAEEYNRPSHIVPREQMWEAVLQGLGNPAKQDAGTVLPFRSRVPRWVYFAVAAALLLAVGIQVGRLMGPSRGSQEALRTPGVRQDSLGAARVSPASATS